MTFNRVFHVFTVLLRHTVAHALQLMLSRWPLLDVLSVSSRLTNPERVRLLIDDLGGTFVKLGQMLALHADIIPVEYCTALMGLFDEVPPFGFEHVQQTVAEDLGHAPLEIFDFFDPHPIATGSIGQVHLASIGTRKLAVKVRRPEALSSFAIDVRLMNCALNLIKLLRLRKLRWMIEPLTEFINWTTDELDYRREAQYAEELAGCRHNQFQVVPAVTWKHTSQRVLTLDYLDGVSVLQYLRARALGDTSLGSALRTIGFEASCFAQNVIRNFLQDALGEGVFHADPHPANLLIMPNNSVGYVDFGISGRLSRCSRQHLSAMTLAYSSGDLDELCASFLRVCGTNGQSNVRRFRSDLETVASSWYEGGRETRLKESVTSTMLQLFRLSRRSNIWPKKEVVKYIRSAIALDGVMKLLDPSVDVGRELAQVLHQHPQWILPGFISASADSLRSSDFQGPDRFFIRQELMNILSAVGHFELDASIDSPVKDDVFLDRVRNLGALDCYHALWAIEGLGFAEAEAAWKANSINLSFESADCWDRLPPSSIAAIHVGRSLSCAKQVLNNQGQMTQCSVKRFFDLCERNSPPGCRGIATEALGFVVRTLGRGNREEVARVVDEIDHNLIAHYWHGVGRAIYFVFPRALHARDNSWVALQEAQREARSETAQSNILAGLAWPLVLVNIRHPEILATFVERHGTGLLNKVGFTTGVATSVLLWATWAGDDDEHLDRLEHFEPQAGSRKARLLWKELISEPCVNALRYHLEPLRRSRRYGELFRFQSLAHLQERLTRNVRDDVCATQAGDP